MGQNIPLITYQKDRSESHNGRVKGVVLDAASRESLIGAHVKLIADDTDKFWGAVSDPNGHFVIDGVPFGMYHMEARMIGFAPASQSFQVTITEAPVMLLLDEDTVELEEIIVQPDRDVLVEAEAHGVHTLSTEQLRTAAQYDEDIYRTVARAPGLVASDFSSQFSIRGGEYDEVLVLFDGLELNDPFHLKDFGGGGVGIIDAGVIGDVMLHTGAFSAEYGDRLSGVFSITSAETKVGTQTDFQSKSALGLSLMNARLFSQGVLRNRNTQWMVSGRRGYLDFLLDLTNAYPSYSPTYFDVFGKITHRFGSRHKVALEGLLSKDRMEYLDIADPNDKVLSSYGNGYVWVNWQTVWHARLFSQTVLSKGRVWRDRNGIDIRRDKLLSFEAKDDRMFNTTQLKQDWTYQSSPTHQIKWGLRLAQHKSNYRYRNARLIQDVQDARQSNKFVNRYAEKMANARPSGRLLNLYTSHRLQLSNRLLSEAGARFGYVTWSNDRYLDPRINFTYQLHPGQSLFLGWGIYHQPQGIDQLYVEDGEQRYYNAERSTHLVAGFKREWPGGYVFNMDVYTKRSQNIRPRYLSLAGEVAEFFPELDDDRVRWQPESGKSRGLELMLQKTRGQRLTGSVSYALSEVVEQLEGKMIPKGFDQRHALFIDANLKAWKNGHLNLSWQFHTGWRYSEVDFEITYQHDREILYETNYGALHAKRFPAYHTLQLRMSQRFSIHDQKLAAYIEIRNLYNRQNIRLYSYSPQFSADGSVNFEADAETWLPRLPAFGLKWEIGY